MRAARVHAFGEPLRLDAVQEPDPGPDESLLEVIFVGVNPIDVWVTDGTVAGGRQRLPFVPGGDGVGTVDGKAVAVRGGGVGILRDGLYRERAAVPNAAVLPLPDGIDLEQAAGLGVPGATAWMLVHHVTGVTAADRVLVLGASGGVGTLAVQLAKATGATVWGQTSSPEKAGFVEGLGGDRVVVAGPEDLAAAVAGLRPTVVIDPLGGGFTVAGIEALEPFGRIGLYGTSAGAIAEMDLRSLYRKSIQLRTYSGTIEPEDRTREALQGAIAAVASGELSVRVDEVLPLERAPEAHERIRSKAVRGKLLLRPRSGAARAGPGYVTRICATAVFQANDPLSGPPTSPATHAFVVAAGSMATAK